MLDPFVLLLLDCINSMHVKVPAFYVYMGTFSLKKLNRGSNLYSPPSQVITEALVAFTWLLKFPLPAVAQNAGQLTKQLFVLLKDYSKAGAARGENYHLVQNCFKVAQIVNTHLKING